MVGVNKEALFDRISRANSTLNSFLALPKDASREELQSGLATVAECVQGMQPIVHIALTLDDARMKQLLLNNREYLQQLKPALDSAHDRLLEHQRRFQLHLVRVRRRGSWADSLRASITDAEPAGSMTVDV
jgi:hypothetical protein